MRVNTYVLKVKLWLITYDTRLNCGSIIKFWGCFVGRKVHFPDCIVGRYVSFQGLEYCDKYIRFQGRIEGRCVWRCRTRGRSRT